MAGYHEVEIPKGELGELSKVKEELAELEDAMNQNAVIMAQVEASDLYGALEAFVNKHLKVSMYDIEVMHMLTKRAFESGNRKSSSPQ